MRAVGFFNRQTCCLLVSVTEIVGVEYRRTVGVIYQMFFSVGILFLPLLAYFITDWRWFQVAITVPYIVFLVYYWSDLLSWFFTTKAEDKHRCLFTLVFCLCRFIPESPRWLLSQNQNAKAVNITEDIAKENKRTLSKNIEVCLQR